VKTRGPRRPGVIGEAPTEEEVGLLAGQVGEEGVAEVGATALVVGFLAGEDRAGKQAEDLGGEERSTQGCGSRSEAKRSEPMKGAWLG